MSFRAGITIPTLETHAMLIDGIPYNELPIVHIQSTPNNTIVTVTNYTGWTHFNKFVQSFSDITEDFVPLLV